MSKKNRDDDKCPDEERKDGTSCFIDQNVITFFNVQPCNGSSQVVFEEFTDNHNKTGISVTNSTSPPCTTILIIETRDDSPPIERILPGVVQGQANTANFQVENLKRLSVRCQGNPVGFCSYTMTIRKTFCICCPPDSNENCC
jgi:hypothetical protein